jgi:hypothetical protein
MKRLRNTPKRTQKQETLTGKISISIVGRKKTNFEKCVCFDGENMPNSARYNTEDKSKLSADVRFIKKNNYPKKILIWEAISNRGISIPYFRPSKSVAVNTEFYINECLQPRLLPFKHQHHSDISFNLCTIWPGITFL